MNPYSSRSGHLVASSISSLIEPNGGTCTATTRTWWNRCAQGSLNSAGPSGCFPCLRMALSPPIGFCAPTRAREPGSWPALIVALENWKKSQQRTLKYGICALHQDRWSSAPVPPHRHPPSLGWTLQTCSFKHSALPATSR